MPVGDADIKMIEDGRNLFRAAYCSSFIVADDTTDNNRRSLFGCAVTKEGGGHELTADDRPIHVASNGDTWFKDSTDHWDHEGPCLVEIHTGGAGTE